MGLNAIRSLHANMENGTEMGSIYGAFEFPFPQSYITIVTLREVTSIILIFFICMGLPVS